MESVNENLLEACKALLDHCSCQFGGYEGEIVPQPCDICDKARDAINEAETARDNQLIINPEAAGKLAKMIIQAEYELTRDYGPCENDGGSREALIQLAHKAICSTMKEKSHHRTRNPKRD